MTDNGAPAKPDLDAILTFNGAQAIRIELHTAAGAIRNLSDNALDALAKFIEDNLDKPRAEPAPVAAVDGMDYDLWLIGAMRAARVALAEVDKRAAAREELRR